MTVSRHIYGYLSTLNESFRVEPYLLLAEATMVVILSQALCFWAHIYIQATLDSNIINSRISFDTQNSMIWLN